MLAELIGHYRVVATLGSGGMGVVWKAIDTRLNRPVALKAIRGSDPQNTEAVLRLRAEALAAASLDHPYICKIYELLETGEATIVVMEFVDGETLADILLRRVPPLVDTLRYGSEIAEGLANAHARGIVHRDVKPSNVMVTPHGHIKLLDFGIARINPDLAMTETGLTLPGNIPGTPQYMSPEQALGRPLDGRADLFSLGILLFRCLTGQLPFEGLTRDEYVQEMLAGRMRPLDELAPSTPESVRSIVKACLQRDPAARPESAAVVAETLRRTVEALSTGTVPIASSPSSRLPGWALPAIVLALAIGGIGLAASLWKGEGAEEVGPRTLLPAVTWPSREVGARVSPDGRLLSFISNKDNQSRIFVQAIEGGDPAPVKIQGAALSHVWSPDSRELAALVGQGEGQFLMVVPALFGGSPRVSIAIDAALSDITILRWIGTSLYLDVNRGQPGRSLLRVALDSQAIDDLSEKWPASLRALRFRNVDVAPDGRQVVLAGTSGDRSDLWTARLDGGDVRRLTDDVYTDRYPVWITSDTIAFESNRGGQMDLWQMSPATSRATQMTSSQMREVATGASVDGSLVAFEQTADSVNLWRLDLAEGRLQQLTADALSDFWPSVSQDGSVLAFQRARPTPVEGFQFLDSRIQIASMVNSPLEPRTVADGFSARLSGNGRWVSYYQRIPERERLRLVAKNLETGQTRTLSDDCVLPSLSATSLPVDFVEQTVTWGPSGAQLFYIVAGEQGHEIHLADLESGQPSRLVGAAAGEEMRDIRISPGGEMVAFLARTRGAAGQKPTYQLRVHDLPAKRTLTLAEEMHYLVLLPGWSSDAAVVLQRAASRPGQLFELDLIELKLDGTRRPLGVVPDSVIPAVRIDPAHGRLFVTRSSEGIHNIHSMSLRDGSMRQLTTNQSPGVSFSGIHPLHAGALIFARDERKSDIWLVRAGAAVK